MKKKLLVIALAFAMILAFAACGGPGQAETSEPASEPAEPNAGAGGIVFTVPDGWTQGNTSVGSYTEYNNADSAYALIVSVFSETDLAAANEWDPSNGAETVEEYYNKYYVPNEEELEKKNFETSTVKVCDADAIYNKYKSKSGDYAELGTYWMYEGKIYSLMMVNSDAYDDEGNLKDDAVMLTDDEISMYEDVVAGVQPGDGSAIQSASLTADSLGTMTFDPPAGFAISEVFDTNIMYDKVGTDIAFTINRTGEESLGDIELSDGSVPESVRALYEDYLYEGIEETTIAGFDGHIEKYPEEDGNYYNLTASFVTDEGVYDIWMGSDAWDEEGNLKEGAQALSEDDIAAFDAVIASLKQK